MIVMLMFNYMFNYMFNVQACFKNIYPKTMFNYG